MYIDAIHYSVRDNGIIRKLAAYVIPGINSDGYKEVFTLQVGENESSKYRTFVMNGLKNRGVSDILIICADGHGYQGSNSNGIPEDGISALYCSSGTRYNEIGGKTGMQFHIFSSFPQQYGWSSTQPMR